MPKLSEMSYWELKGLERALHYLIADNPELSDNTLTELHEIVNDKRERAKNEP